MKHLAPLLLSATLLAGADYTRGVGEEDRPNLALAADARTRWIGAEALYVAAPKLESGAGYLATGAVEVYAPWTLSAGARYSYRDGGSWTKQTWWARVGIGGESARLIFERALNGYNEESKIEARFRWFWKRLVVDLRTFLLIHIQGTGAGYSLMLGLR
jgi:hypothetical protein